MKDESKEREVKIILVEDDNSDAVKKYISEKILDLDVEFIKPDSVKQIPIVNPYSHLHIIPIFQPPLTRKQRRKNARRK